MKAEPTELDRSAVIAALASGWGIEARSLGYVAVGFGSHHYDVMESVGQRWFATIDDMALKPWLDIVHATALDLLGRAFRTAILLAAGGLDFVAAPEPTTDGDPLVRLGPRFAVSVTRFIEGEVQDPETTRFEGARREAVFRSLGRLHATTPALPNDLPRIDRLEITSLPSLLEALELVDEPWDEGPHSERARSALRARSTAVRHRLERFHPIAAHVSSDARSFMITHGEPHPGNVIWRPDGSHVFIDWDTIALAPAERDLWMLAPTDDDLETYAAAGGHDRIRPEALALYREWWDLSEVAMAVDVLRAPHVDDANTRASLDSLMHYLRADV